MWDLSNATFFVFYAVAVFSFPLLLVPLCVIYMNPELMKDN